VTHIPLAIIIPTFNGRAMLERCLSSVIAATRRGGLESEIIVVDDASTDGTAHWLRQAYPQVKVLVRNANGGFAKAANTGLRAADADWVALVNNDVVLDADWVRCAFSRPLPPDAGALATRILQQDAPGTLYSAGDEYATCGLALQWLSGRPVEADDRRPACFSACAAAAFYRRSALDRCGLFRESLGAYYEDVDLGFRLNLAGYRCLYVPDAVSWHLGRGSYGRRRRTVAYRSARNREIVFWANMPLRLLARYAPLHVAAALAHPVLGLGRGEALARAAGFLAGLARLGEVLRIRRELRPLRTLSPANLRRRLRTDGIRQIRRRPAPAAPNSGTGQPGT
jgi:GT2 family glycosyltransferase